MLMLLIMFIIETPDAGRCNDLSEGVANYRRHMALIERLRR